MKIDLNLKPDYLIKKNISKRIKKILMGYAKEAHEIDSSKPITFYYELFLSRVDEKFLPKVQLREFFKNKIIET